MTQSANPEALRMQVDTHNENRDKWYLWGPYLSERQWGTVREDYSSDGNAWNFFPFSHAHSRVYRWGEDGLAGWCDIQQRICLGLALWNEKDPILKERLFGLSNDQGNHGEDVKEYYYYLDALPSHSYLKMLYKYPQAMFPYQQLIDESKRRDRNQAEFELIDTGIFDQDRYFDVFVQYAKASEQDTLMQISITNRGPEKAPLHVIPQLWFRNTWKWQANSPKPQINQLGTNGAILKYPDWQEHYFYADGNPEILFCENETNMRIHGNKPNARGFFKDGFHDYLIHKRQDAVNPNRSGTKMGIHYRFEIEPGATVEIKCRLTPSKSNNAFSDFSALVGLRKQEADHYYQDLQEGMTSEEDRLIQRQALAGMIWSKQFFYYDVRLWLNGDPGQPPPPADRKGKRNFEWQHLHNSEVISMPDKWEYPWYAAWDLAFHCVPLALVDPEFAKDQLLLLTREWYMHPNGQLPGYEWNFNDVNPPVHAWATWRVFQIDRTHNGSVTKGDIPFLERVFQKLLLNFTWWVNRKDANGRNIFQGGFLGMDNIGIFDRNAPLPDGYVFNQADGTAWMAMYSLNMLRISLELALHNPVYEDIATKFFEHFLYIAGAMTNMRGGDKEQSLWDEEDEFYYDEIITSKGDYFPLKVRSMVGLIPLFAVQVLEPYLVSHLPKFCSRLEWFLKFRPDLAQLISRWHDPGKGEKRLLSLLRGHRMKCLLRRMLNETEFLSDYGVRSLSKIYQQPYEVNHEGRSFSIRYVPGDSDSPMFGGNSNWRGPIWFPVNYLIIESLYSFHQYYGDDFQVECPVGSKNFLSIEQIADELSNRLMNLFRTSADGSRPVAGSHPKLKTDPHFRDYIQFYEFFHGDDGHGLGASHQTGWTGLVAELLRRAKH